MAERATAPGTPELRDRRGGIVWADATAILGAVDVVFGECDR